MSRQIILRFAAFLLCTGCAHGQGPPFLTVPGRVVERELLVPIRVGNQGPLWFALDTGLPRSAIDGEVASTLHLDLRSQDPKAVTARVQLDVGGAKLDTIVDVTDLGVAEYERAYDQPLAGLLGMDFFEKYIVTLDYDAAVMSLRSATVILPKDGSIPLTFHDSLPYVEGWMKLPGRSAVQHLFQLDTSTGDAINDEEFAHLSRPSIGPDLGRAECFRIGPYRFSGINGTSGTPKLGGELLHRFLVTVDASHRRLILTPSRHFGDAFLFDTSGLDLERSVKGLTILHVFPRTPGAEAGLTSGETILSIDGQLVENFTVPQVRLMFHEAGNHTLSIDSNGVERTVEIKLRNLL